MAGTAVGVPSHPFTGFGVVVAVAAGFETIGGVVLPVAGATGAPDFFAVDVAATDERGRAGLVAAGAVVFAVAAAVDSTVPSLLGELGELGEFVGSGDVGGVGSVRPVFSDALMLDFGVGVLSSRTSTVTSAQATTPMPTNTRVCV